MGDYPYRTRPWVQQNPPLGYQLDRSSPFASGLVGCWLFNEQSGAIANNLAGKNNAPALLVNSPAWRDGVLLKPADSQYINCGNAAALNVGYGSYEAIVKLNNTISGDTGIMSRSDDTGGSRKCPELLISGGTLYGVVSDGAGLNYTGLSYTFSQSMWTHVVFTWDANWLNLYINGLSVIAPKANTKIQQPSTNNLKIGSTWGTNYWPGYIKKASVYNRALSAAEVSYLYANPYAPILGYNMGRVFSVPSGNYFNPALLNNNIIDGSPFAGAVVL